MRPQLICIFIVLCVCVLVSVAHPGERSQCGCPKPRPPPPLKNRCGCNPCDKCCDPCKKKKCNKCLHTQEEDHRNMHMDDEDSPSTNDSKAMPGKTEKGNNENVVGLTDNVNYYPDSESAPLGSPQEVKQWVVKIDPVDQRYQKGEINHKGLQSQPAYAMERSVNMPSDYQAVTKMDGAVNRVARLTKNLQGTLEDLLGNMEVNNDMLKNGSEFNSALKDALSELTRVNGNVPGDSGTH